MVNPSNCPVWLFLPFVVGTAACSLFLSVLSLVICSWARSRLNGVKRAMPFRTQSLELLRHFVIAAIIVQSYFLVSTLIQTSYRRPICLENGALLPYLLAWFDWFAIFFFSIWPAVLLLVLLRNVWLEATGRGDVEIVQPGQWRQ